MVATRGRIMKRTVEDLEAPPVGELMFWDEALAGFGVPVRAGGAKTYLVMYRAGTGRSAPLRKMTIGKHGSFTPDAARTEAKRLLGLAASGADPAAAKAERRQSVSVADLVDRFITDHVEAKRKERTTTEVPPVA